MSERVRLAVRWVVVAVLAVLALLAPRGASEPTYIESVAPVTAGVPPTRTAVTGEAVLAPPPAAAPAPRAPLTTAAALDALASGASCADRLAAVEHLRAAGDPAAVPALTAAARDDACVATAARAAIRALGRAEPARW